MSWDGVPSVRSRRASLRVRVSLWNASVVAVTLAVLTALAIHDERLRLVQAEAANARTLLDHLAAMPEFREAAPTVTAHLDAMRDALRATGGRLVLLPEGTSSSEADGAQGVVATRRLSLRDGFHDLRFVSDQERLHAMARRSLAMHLVYGIVALAAIVGGTEWILRRKLLAPLESLSIQIDHMREGNGWLPQVAPADAELAGVARAVADLGPALERQVLEWIEAERRSAAVLAIGGVRRRLCAREVYARTADLATAASPSRNQEPGSGALAASGEWDWIARALAEEEAAAVRADGRHAWRESTRRPGRVEQP